MNEMQIFDNPEFGSIRTLTIENEPYFVGKDVAEILGYMNASKAVFTHVDTEDKAFVMLDIADSQNGNVPVGQTKTAVINESGLYSLILSSKLPSAKRFKRWVTSEVLPAIRKTGRYEIPQERQYQPTRPLTSDDYMDAGKAVSRCDNRRLPIVLDLFRKAGLDIQKIPDIQKRNQESDNEYLVELLNQYGLDELTKKLGISRTSIYYYRIGKYKPNKKRKELIIKILTEDDKNHL